MNDNIVGNNKTIDDFFEVLDEISDPVEDERAELDDLYESGEAHEADNSEVNEIEYQVDGLISDLMAFFQTTDVPFILSIKIIVDFLSNIYTIKTKPTSDSERREFVVSLSKMANDSMEEVRQSILNLNIKDSEDTSLFFDEGDSFDEMIKSAIEYQEKLKDEQRNIE